MRLRITPASWGLLGLGLAVGWCWGQGRVPFFDRAEIGSRIGAALEEPDTLLRFEALARTLRGVTASNQADAFAGLEAHRVGIDEAELDVVIHALTEADPPSAFERIKGWPQRGDRVYALRELFYAWARMDPGAALNAFDSEIAGTSDAAEIQKKLVAGWARSGDWIGATQYLASLETPVPRQELATRIAEARLEYGGVEAVIDWAESLKPEAPLDLKRDVLVKAARVVALADAPRAAEWVRGYAGKEGTVGAIRVVGIKWAQEDPAAAFAWARSLPEHDERSMVLNQSFQRMLQADTEGTEAWIREASLDASDDPIVVAYANWLAGDRPMEAVEWAQRIQDEGLRLRTLTAVGRVWYRRDPAAAIAWLDQSDLPEEAQKAVLAPQGSSNQRLRRLGRMPAIAPRADGGSHGGG